jgi:hypothetical protein
MAKEDCFECPVMERILNDEDVGEACDYCCGFTTDELDPECVACEEGDCESCAIAIQKAEMAIGA